MRFCVRPPSTSIKGGDTGADCLARRTGSVRRSGLYTAPNAIPSPNAVTVILTGVLLRWRRA